MYDLGKTAGLKVLYEDLEIAEVIGRGCSSFVLRARHIGTDKLLALKVREKKESGIMIK